MILKENDPVTISETGEVGYIERVLDGGDRLMVRIPGSWNWPYPHHVYVDKEKVRKAAKPKPDEEAIF